MRRVKKNIVIYCHNFWWLWHTRRISLIIKEILLNFWDYYNVIFLNSWKNQDFLFKNIQWIKIINMPNYIIENYKIISGENVSLSREKIFKTLFSIWNIEKLIIEHYPFWRNFLNDEIRDLIKIYRTFNNKWYIFSSVRDIFDINSINEQNLNLFDRYLIHWDTKILNYNNDFWYEIKKKIVYTWYVLDKNNLFDDIEEDYILINLWWWQDGFEFVINFLNKFKKLNITNKIYINLWLSYSIEKVEFINSLKIENIVIKDFFDDFIKVKQKAKIVVSMWWYNSFIENIFYNKISIIYPRQTDIEQINRLNIFRDKFNNIYDGRSISSSIILDLINWKNKLEQNYFNNNWWYFSASFIVNFGKYKYLKIRVTNLCNAKCEMCWVIKRDKKNNDLKKINESILGFYKMWWKVINFTWWEPTIYNWFWDLLKLSKWLWLITSVSTNWSTLWERFFKKLFSNGVKLIDYIDISIDWLYLLHDNRRNFKWLFKKINDNLHILIENNIFIHINITIRKDNIWEILDIFNYFKDKKVDSISFWMIASDPLNDTSYLIPKNEDLQHFYLVDKIKINENAWKIKINFSPDFDGLDIFTFIESINNKNAFKKINNDTCSFIQSKKEIRINEWGNVTPCCILDDFDEWLWNINKTNFINIICSKKYEDFLNKKFPNISVACLNCKLETN